MESKSDEWIPRQGKCNRGRQEVSWSDEIKKFAAGITWKRLIRDKANWKSLTKAFDDYDDELPYNLE